MKKILITIVAVFASSAAFAQPDLDALSKESSIAAAAGDLGSARELSARLLDGSLLSKDAPAVYLELAPAKQEKIKFSAPAVKAKAVVPPLQTGASGSLDGKAVHAHSLGSGIESALKLPFTLMTKAGDAVYKATGGDYITGIIAAAFGLVAGIIAMPFALVINTFKALK